jgi:hypothetical protein
MLAIDQLKEQASFGVVLLSFGVVVLHLQITRRIDQIGKL